MNYLTAHSEAGANILAKSGYALRQVGFVGDGFEYIFEIPSILPDGRETLAGGSLLPSDDVAEGVGVLSVEIFADKADAQKDSPSGKKVLRVSSANALSDQLNLGQDFKGSLRLDFEGIFHGGSMIRASIERQGTKEAGK